MVSGHFALLTAAAFAGAAIYINIAEHPARIVLKPQAQLQQWKRSYVRAFAMQASLALISAICGLFEFWLTRNWWWFAGAALVFANWPYTLIVMLPLNKQLQAIAEEKGGAEVPALLEIWDGRHAIRSVLGVAAVAAYLWALN